MTTHVSLCADRPYAVPLAVTLASLALRAGPCEVTILHDGLDPGLRRRIAGDSASVLTVEWIPLQVELMQGLHLPAFVTTATAGRLLLADVLRHHARTIYLDCDLLCLDVLQDLFGRELTHGMLGAVRDGLIPFAAGPLGTDWWELGLPADSAYFNAGVLLMDLAALREEQVGERSLRLMRERRLRWADQCALNTVLNGRWEELPRCWNVQTADINGTSLTWALWPESTAEAVDQPAILHYTERDKPWHRDSAHPARAQWREIQALTSWPRWTAHREGSWWHRRLHGLIQPSGHPRRTFRHMGSSSAEESRDVVES